MNTPHLALALLSVVLTTTDTPAASRAERRAGPAVVVHLQSGRTFSGHVDPQTDQREFVLQSRVGCGLIVRPIQWERLVRAEIVGAEISGVELHRLVTAIRMSVKPPAPQPPRPALRPAAGAQSTATRESSNARAL